MKNLARAAAVAVLLAPALANAQCEPAWLFDDNAQPPVPPAASDAAKDSQSLVRVRQGASFKRSDVQKRFADPSAKSPTIEQFVANWMLVARDEKADDGVYDRWGLLNKDGEPGVLYVASADNPFVGPRTHALVYVQGVNYADGDPGIGEGRGFEVSRSEKALEFSETFVVKNARETRRFSCKLVAEGQLLCEVRRSVAFLGFSGEYQDIPQSAYTAYYGFSKVRPAR